MRGLTHIQIVRKGLGHFIALFLKVGRDKDAERHSQHGEYAVHANLWQRIGNDKGDDGCANEQTQNG